MDARPLEKQLLAKLPAALASALDVPEREVEVQAGAGSDIDMVLSAAGQVFVVEALGVASPGTLAAHEPGIAAAIRDRWPRAIPLLVVPFMSDAGRRICEGAKTQWLDLSGNAHIVAPGLRILIEGRPNRFREPGRPASIFAPKSARVVRCLLANEWQALTQREIARATDMTEGFVSRIVSRLEHENYIARQPRGGVRVRDPRLLLEAWRDEYHFEKHTIIQGHIAARSGDALTRFVGDTLAEAAVEHAATGLAAAWMMTRFAAFRIATFFLQESPRKELREKIGFREEERGANLWLVVPNDAGVFHEATSRDGVRCVHPVQAYIDLKAHPERAPEAAERLRNELLNWKHDG
jgi:hypothetical protein